MSQFPCRYHINQISSKNSLKVIEKNKSNGIRFSTGVSINNLSVNQIINNLVSNDQVLRNEIAKLKSSQNLLVSKLHNLEAFVHDVSNEVARLRSQETLAKTTPKAQ